MSEGGSRRPVFRFSNIQEVRTVFRHADKVGKFTVFNIGGNKARLVAAINYNRSKVYNPPYFDA